MKPVIKYSLLTRSILLATTSGFLISSAFAGEPIVNKSVHKGVVDSQFGQKHEAAWSVQHPNGSATLSDASGHRNVYYSYLTPRGKNDTQNLTIVNTDLSGHYVNMTKNGHAALLMTNSSADFIESGDDKFATDTTIVLEHSVLNGPKMGHDYDAKGSDKNYLSHAAIYQDQKDNGNFNLFVNNQSQVNGGVHSIGGGEKAATILNSRINKGDITLQGKNIILNSGNSLLDGNINLTAKGNVKVNAVNSQIKGNVAARGNDVLVRLDNSLAGDMSVSAKTAFVDLKHATVKSLNGMESGDMIVKMTGASHVTGDVKLGHGKNTVFMSDHSSIEGTLDGGSADKENALYMDSSSSVKGKISRIGTIRALAKNSIITPELSSQSVEMRDHSVVTAETINNVTVTTDTSGQLYVTKGLLGHNVLNIAELSSDAVTGTHDIARVVGNSDQLQANFANGKKTAVARAGAKNYDLALTAESVSAAADTTVAPTTVQLHIKETGLTSDVKGAIAGLEGARQSGSAFADTLSRHLTASTVPAEGISVWADYVMRNADNVDAVDYHNKLQGSVLGMDWTHGMGELSHFTTGVALGMSKNKLSGSSDMGEFNNKVNGRFYSLYAGWKKDADETGYGYFANGSATYGNLDFSQQAQNIGSSTKGDRETLQNGYKGKTYNLEVRTGMNIRLTEFSEVQPYVFAGWSKAVADGFSNRYVEINQNSNAAAYAGGGIRLTGKMNAGTVSIKPWVDASYAGEFSKKADFRVNGESVSGGKKRQTGTVGAGLDADITPALSLNAGAYTDVSHTRNNIAVLAGVKYNF